MSFFRHKKWGVPILPIVLIVSLFASCSIFRKNTRKGNLPTYVKLSEEEIKTRKQEKVHLDSLTDTLLVDTLPSLVEDSIVSDTLRDSTLSPTLSPIVPPQPLPLLEEDTLQTSEPSLEKKDTIVTTKDTIKAKTDSIGVPTDTLPHSHKKTNKSRVFLLHADRLSFNKKENPDAQLLSGNVRFRHDSTYMSCDSAYFYQEANSFEAFGNTEIVQGDSIYVYGDELYYDGQTRIARLRENVRLEKGVIYLVTDSLDYDRNKEVASYFSWGLLADTSNILTSVNGTYYPNTDIAIFKDSVRLENDDMWMITDSLQYNSKTQIATLIAPTLIYSSDSTSVVHSSKGNYNTADNYSILLNRSIVEKGVRQLTGDSIIYDEKKEMALAFGNVEVYDTERNSTLYGGYARYEKMEENKENNEDNEEVFMTDSALLVYRTEEDTLYIHADTFRMVSDSSYKILRAYHNVRFYKTSAQGICDSLEYRSRDSIATMYDRPVLWSENAQLTGDTISCFMNDSTIEWAHLRPFAFSIEKVGKEDKNDTTEGKTKYYNQVSGREMFAYFDGNDLRKVYVEGNVQTIYYPLDSDQEITGMNNAVSSYLSILLKNKKLERLVMWPKVDGTMYPLIKVDNENSILKGFKLFDALRPSSPQDVFRKDKREDVVDHVVRKRRPIE